jgi:hypothetical protein
MVRSWRTVKWFGVALSAAAVLMCAAAPAQAQRPTASFEWQKHEAGVTYGVPRVGKHSIDELKVGDSWRMGAFNASTLVTTAPLIVGDSVVAPGAFRVKIGRPGREGAPGPQGAGTSVESTSGGCGATMAQAKTRRTKPSLARAREGAARSSSARLALRPTARHSSPSDDDRRTQP